MPGIKEYNNIIKSLKNTEKMTRTMKMVSASKLRRAQEAQVKAKLYARRLTDLIGRLSLCLEETSHPLLKHREQVKKVLILVLTSDKGLCGSFNHSVSKRVVAWINEHKSRYERIDLSFCGKRGYTYLKNAARTQKHYERATEKPNYAKAVEISDELSQSFLLGEYDEVYIAYNVFTSALFQKPTIDKILPIESSIVQKEKNAAAAIYIFEPSAQDVLTTLIPKYVHFRFYFALLENAAGEHGARMTAMDSASRNTGELIDRYTLLRNRVRQNAITKELIEIISGVEALNRG